MRVETGELPAAGELLSDVQNANESVYDGDTGDSLNIIGPQGVLEFRVSGRGRTLPGGEMVQDEHVAVLYAPMDTVTELRGQPGIDELRFRLIDPDPAAAQATMDAIRGNLMGLDAFPGFVNLATIRAPGDWPGRSESETFGQFVVVLTILSVLSATVLIANTMTTLVAEQTKDIAVMRALGARRQQIAAIYLRTTMIMALAGALLGTIVGVVLSSLLADYFSRSFWMVPTGFGLVGAMIALSMATGIIVPPLAALPAIRRALAVPVREGLDASGSSLGPQTVLDQILRRVTWLPRTAQIGLRNAGRRWRRSAATVSIVALAVANLLATMALGTAVTDTTRSMWASHRYDIELRSTGFELFDGEAREQLAILSDVAEVESMVTTRIAIGWHDAPLDAQLWGLESDPLVQPPLSSGRWFDPASETIAAVGVIEETLAGAIGIELGDQMAVQTAGGSHDVTIIGTVDTQQLDGRVLYMPIATAQGWLSHGDDASSLLIQTMSPETAVVDRVSAAAEDVLVRHGYDVATTIRYVAEREAVQANASVARVIAALGFIIVATSLIGLANTMTTSILERTREIGVLRSIGARSRDIRRMFTVEGLSLAVVGWVLGVPLGYGFTWALSRLIWELIELRLPVVFPWVHVGWALAGTLILTVLIMTMPLRRAARVRAGDALRYG